MTNNFSSVYSSVSACVWFQAKINRFKQLLRVSLSLGLEVIVLTVCVSVLGFVLQMPFSIVL